MKPALRAILLSTPRLSLRRYSNSRPLYIAHRGGSLIAPENTMEAYAHISGRGLVALEQDVHLLSDGALGVIHDATIDRTTTGTGNVADQSAAQFQALTIDAATQNVMGYGDALNPPLFPTVVSAYRGQSILVPEVKVGGVAQLVVDALVAGGVPRGQALVQCFGFTGLEPAVAAGYDAMYLTAGDTVDIPTAIAAGVKWVGIASTASEANISAWVAAGLKVIAYTVNRRYDRDRLLALGVTGFFSDDPDYLASSSPLGSADTWANGKFMDGMQEAANALTAVTRGTLRESNYWGWQTAPVGQTNYVLQGWAGPITAGTWSVDYTVRFNSVTSDTRWAAVFLADTSLADRGYTDTGTSGSTTEKGYNILTRKNGVMDIYLRNGGTATQIATVNSGAAIADAEAVKFRVSVTPTTVKIARLNANGTEQSSVTATDSTYRGPYFHFGRNGCAAEFADVSVSA